MRKQENLSEVIQQIHEYNIDYQLRQIFISPDTKGLTPDDDFAGIDEETANKFIKNLSILEESDEPILIHLNNINGGIWHGGMAIYDAIASSHCYITILCHGVVMSMASIVLQAADKRVSMPGCVFMLHEGVDSTGTTHKQNQAWAVFNKQAQLKMMQLYAEKFKNGEVFKDKSTKQIKSYIQNKFNFKEDWILSAEEALNHGIIDSILTSNRKDLIESRT